MIEGRYLAYHTDAFGNLDPIIIASDGAEAPRPISLQYLGTCERPLITYDAWRLVDLLRERSLPVPSTLIDIGDALKLLSGRSRDQGGEKHWDVWHVTRDFFDTASDADTIAALLDARIASPEPAELTRLITAACVSLSRLWPHLCRDLSLANETRRFFEVEVPVQQIFHRRQHQGIAVDHPALETLLEAAEMEKYDAYRKLADILGFNPDSLNFWNAAPFIERTDASGYGPLPEGSLHEYLRMVRHRSTFADSFINFVRAKQSYSILMRIPRRAERLYPTFACFGTVTGRIRVVEPMLQELRKRYRGILIADVGKTLRYLDFAQFEPGILAQGAGDHNFLRQYNSTDLYSTLSQRVFGDEEHRPLCKLLFLSYCYGMSQENMVRLIAGSEDALADRGRCRMAITQFFDSFPGLQTYRQSQISKLAAEGQISTLMGNHRKRTSEGPLAPKEERWAINQAIQGSASLIFKSALLKLADAFGRNSILLPMHDAVLMQFDEINAGPAVSEAEDFMAKAFREWCPDVRPRVVAANFTASG